ncbi:MAG: hypothetical protein M3Y70_01235 [Pseudomonadota bacterium]|nr:hypothetical protein [Pseudomonadota bacterium]
MHKQIRTIILASIVFLGMASAPDALAQFNNTTPRATFAGTHNYVVTGGTLRGDSNDDDACDLNTSSTAALSGIPGGSTILGAFLYWGGSGSTGDYSVTFGPTGATANRTAAGGNQFSELFNEDGYNFSFFGAYYDATAIVAGKAGGPNGNYSLSNLAVTNSGAYCTNQTTLAAWALVVVYSNPSESYRYTRVYDGLQYFRGSSVTTTQSGFRVPDLLDGKVTTVTWEGDPDTATSFALDGFDEALSFDGNPLLNAGCDGNNNLYNSTLNTTGSSCVSTNYGADVDTYDITNYLYEGQTGATLEYSSGNDLVLLTAQVISTTNTPVADLGITKTHNGSFFTVGQNGSYNIVVHNHGPEIATGTATVTDTLPTGLTYVSGTGTGWACSAVGQVVTCNNSQTSLAIGADLPALTLTVAVGAAAAASTENTATVSHPMFDGTGGNQSDDDTVAVRGSNLSTSSKTVVDLNGNDVEPGDILRYTITLNETGAFGIDATGVSVVDDLADNLGDLSIVSIPSGATDNSIGSGGANGTGQVNVTGITVPSGATRSIVFDVTVFGDAEAGDTIDNAATIANPTGPGATPSASQLTVAVSQAPVTGEKRLYVYNNLDLTRVPQTANSTTGVTIDNDNDSSTWVLTSPVATGKSLILPEQTVAVQLVTRASGSSTGSNTRNVIVQLLNDGVVIGADTVGVVGTGNTLRTWSIDIDPTIIQSGDSLEMRVENTHQSNNRDIVVVSRTSAANYSRIIFDSDTVVNVDAVGFHTAAYAAAGSKTVWNPGNSVYIRADVSDPFGGYDVSGARLTLTDPDGTVHVNNAVMPAVTNPSNNGTPNRYFEYQFNIPGNPDFGNWVASVTATEGSETPAVTHTRNGVMRVEPQALAVLKTHSGDFTAGANNSFTLTVSNSGGATINGTTTVKDTLAAGLTFVSGTGTGWSCSSAGQVVTCTSNASIPASSSMAPITLTVAVAGNMGASVANQASVGNSTIAGGYQKPGNTDTAIVRHSDLSTSTKSVSDLNGGDANPGDSLRYSIDVIESAGYPANNVTVSDVLPYGLTGLAGLNVTLTTCNGTPSVVGGTLTVTGLSLAGGASCAIVFDVQVSGSAGAGLLIDNVATINNPAGDGATPNAPVTVSQSQVLNPGDKVLYGYANNTMTRVAQAANGNNTINEGSYQDFILSGISSALTIAPGSTITVHAWLRRTGSTTTTARSLYARLLKNGTTQIGSTSNTVGFTSTNAARQQFTITAPSFGSAGNLVPGDTLVLRIYNDSGSGGNDRTVRFDQRVTGGSDADDLSIATISTPTVVNVGSVAVYSAAYPSTSQAAAYGPGETIHVRATVTDPFGFADISGGSITIKNPGGSTVHTANLVNGSHTESTSGATRVYEYAYVIPGGAPTGAWTASVTANEGAEGTITHTGNGGFSVGGQVKLRKVWGPGATAGHAVSLTISGGTGAVAGSSTAPSTLVEAVSNAATGATITLAEAFTNGSAGEYTVTLACLKDIDSTTVTPVGTGLSRTITMPAGSVTCTWTNSKTVPLTVVKLVSAVSDQVNGTSNPKAIPGAIMEYQIIVTNPAAGPVDTDSVFLVDPVPDQLELRVADIGGTGSGPISFTDGSPGSGLAYTFTALSSSTDDVAFSNDEGATWVYTPVPGVDGVDPSVTHIRINPKGLFNANNAQFTVRFRTRIK